MVKKYKTIYEKCLEALRRCMPPSQVRKKYGSGSSYARALQDFTVEKEPLAEEIQGLYRTRDTILGEVKLRITQKLDLDTQILEKNKFLTNQQRTSEDLIQKTNETQALLQTNQMELDTIKKSLLEFEKQGISQTLLKRIHLMELKNGEDLLTRVETEAAYIQTKRGFESTKREKASVEMDIVLLKKVKTRFNTEIKTQKNILDEWKLKTYSVQEAVKIIEEFFADGYSIEDIQALKTGLNILAIKGKPILSITRLVQYLQKTKSLTNLNNEIHEKTQVYETLMVNIGEAKGTLNAITEIILKTMEEVKEKAIQEIKRASKATVSETQKIGKTSETHLTMIRSESIKQIETVHERAIKSLQDADAIAAGIVNTLETQIKRVVNNLKNSLFITIQDFQDDFETWNTIQEKISKYEEIGMHGKVLMGILEDPQAIKELPPSLIATIVDRIHLYVSSILPNATTQPSDQVYKLDSNIKQFNRYYGKISYKLCALTFWLKEAFEKRVQEGG